VQQEYLPEELRGREYYHPNDRGYEHEVSQRLDKVRSILHSETAPDGYTESKEQNG
jgi:putative ATPase